MRWTPSLLSTATVPTPCAGTRLTNAQPWDNLKFDEAGVEEVRRKFFGTLYNSYSVFAYMPTSTVSTLVRGGARAERAAMFDRWIISRLNTLVASVRAAYETTT